MYMFGSHSGKWERFTVSLLLDGNSSFYFSRKLFKFGAYENSLDHFDCSHGVLAEFCNRYFTSGNKFLSHQ